MVMAFREYFSGEGFGRDNLIAPKGHKLSDKRTGFGRSSGKVKCKNRKQDPKCTVATDEAASCYAEG